MAGCLLALLLLYRRIEAIGRLSKYLWVGVVSTVLLVIAAGLSHFSAARALSFSPNAFQWNPGFFMGLGSAMLIATYDYWGYYNVCFLGAEIRQPERNIPRAIVYSIAAVAAFYVVMNISVLGAVPWQELDRAAASETRFYVASTVLQRSFGDFAGNAGALLVIWTAFASVFSLMLGASRVPYAAAVDGNFFSSFARLHPENRFPHVSLVTLGSVATVFCLFRLQDVIAALVVIRITVQFLMQILGLILLRLRRPEVPRPFRMYLYPAPALLAAGGFLYVLFMRPDFAKEIRYALAIIVVGVAIYLLRSFGRAQWPFAASPNPLVRLQ
jgi:amino acid transporter